MIKVSDYIAQTLAENGISDVFLVTGGGAMHLNDAIGKCPDLNYICCHHEQACAMAAESYYRLTNRLAAVNVTTGPGGTNAITGVFGAWTDSLGMVVISGQVKWETVVRSTNLPLRQLGDQEIDIIKMVQSITKYAVMVTEPESIRYHLERAIHLAKYGRPGPVWLDIPLDVQGAKIDPESLLAYNPSEDEILSSTPDLANICDLVMDRLKQYQRPVIIAGNGVRLGGAHQEFLHLIDRWQIPVVTAWNAHDLIDNNHSCYIGRPGTIGDRAGNFAVQNADFILVLGCRLNIRQISYNWHSFASHAYKVIVDIDTAELNKPTVKADLPVHANVKDFLSKILNTNHLGASLIHQSWLKWCKDRQHKYPVTLAEYWLNKDSVNPYCFAESLFEKLPDDAIVVTGNGSACVTTFQAAVIKQGQRLYTNSGCASMGYDLPAAIGACVANQYQQIICITGDGSIQMNLQELQTIVGYQLPIKIFVMNNNGYHSIRQTQNNYFPDNAVGCDASSGITFPSLEKLAFAYVIPYLRCNNHEELTSSIQATLDSSTAVICEVMIDTLQSFAPKLTSKQLSNGQMISPPLEDMFPFLSETELLSNMFVKS
jgi:acetolactate synthase I/II/III large subunit